MTVTPDFTVPSFPAGYGPQQGDFTAWWAAAAAFMQQRVVFRAVQSATPTSLPSDGATEVIIFDTVLEDPYSGYNASNGRWTAPAGGTGLYHVTAGVWVEAPTSTGVVLACYLGNPDGGLLTAGVPLGQCTIPAVAAGVCGSAYQWITGAQDYVYIGANLGNLGSGSLSTNLAEGQQPYIEVVLIQT